jgi:hypothetical protein
MSSAIVAEYQNHEMKIAMEPLADQELQVIEEGQLNTNIRRVPVREARRV